MYVTACLPTRSSSTISVQASDIYSGSTAGIAGSSAIQDFDACTCLADRLAMLIIDQPIRSPFVVQKEDAKRKMFNGMTIRSGSPRCACAQQTAQQVMSSAIWLTAFVLTCLSADMPAHQQRSRVLARFRLTTMYEDHRRSTAMLLLLYVCHRFPPPSAR